MLILITDFNHDFCQKKSCNLNHSYLTLNPLYTKNC